MLRPAAVRAHTTERTTGGGSSAGLDRTCRGGSGVRRKSSPVASDEVATSRSCQCRCPPLRLSGAARAVQPAFDAARPESRNRGGQRSVRSIVRCHGGRRGGHAGRAARRRRRLQGAGTSGTSRFELSADGTLGSARNGWVLAPFANTANTARTWAPIWAVLAVLAVLAERC